jgi:hypothetical protein
MIILGFAPAPFLAKSEPAVKELLHTIESKRIAAEEMASLSEGIARWTPDSEDIAPALTQTD